MKNITAALIFPETEPSVPGMAKLLVFFDALSYYLPTESDGSNNRGNKFLTNLCTAYAPAPLGEDLSRFCRLLREMETGRPDEIVRLFSAASAPIASGQVRDQDEISAGSVYSALQKDTETKTGILNKERLWQARLILKLAEMLIKKEAEVKLGLEQAATVEQKILSSLKGSGEMETGTLADLNNHGKPQYPEAARILPEEGFLEASDLLIPLRVKAWAELYLADSLYPNPLILVTTIPESGALLLDGYENIWGRDAKKLFSLSIPAVSPSGMKDTWDQYLESRNTFRVAAKENMQCFAQFLQEKASMAGSAPTCHEDTMLAENVSAWEKKVKMHFPDTEADFKKLDFYCLPNISFTEMFQRLFLLEGPVPGNKAQHSTALVAILNL